MFPQHSNRYKVQTTELQCNACGICLEIIIIIHVTLILSLHWLSLWQMTLITSQSPFTLSRAQVLRERVGTEFLHFFHSRNSVPFARLEQPSRPRQSFTKRRCPAGVTVRGRRTLVILYVTGRFL